MSSEWGSTALMEACKRADLHMAKWLVKKGADVNLFEVEGLTTPTALNYALPSRAYSPGLITMLLSQGVDWKFAVEQLSLFHSGLTSMFDTFSSPQVVDQNRNEVIRFLVDSIRPFYTFKFTVLRGVQQDSCILASLPALKASRCVVEIGEFTGVPTAAEVNHIIEHGIKCLVEQRESIKTKQLRRKKRASRVGPASAADRASMYGDQRPSASLEMQSSSLSFLNSRDVDRSRLLSVLRNANSSWRDHDGKSVLHHAARHNMLDIVQYLINERNMNVDDQCTMGHSVVMAASM